MAALQRPAAPQAVGDQIDVFRAAGTLKPQGSLTEFNAQYRAEVGGETLPQQALTALRTGGRSLLANAGDATRRAYLGRNNATLADIHRPQQRRTDSTPRRARRRDAHGRCGASVAAARAWRRCGSAVRHRLATPLHHELSTLTNTDPTSACQKLLLSILSDEQSNINCEIDILFQCCCNCKFEL
ncbi:hypothetical protein [Methylobacterium sp. Leaf456]|uniref:hypothetical protein n=1 Tax=Methylobacterium sp. Leaf456 TaxID=1736382 RepID=UPI000AA8AD00|nr:hypothetical protein [Methylobacterium sp. Leaf456]